MERVPRNSQKQTEIGQSLMANGIGVCQMVMVFANMQMEVNMKGCG